MRVRRQRISCSYWCVSTAGALAVGALLILVTTSRPSVTSPSQATVAPVSGQRSGRLQAGSARSGGLQAANARSADLQVGIGGLKSAATPAATLRLVESYGKLPLSFEANQGQTDGQVKFLARGRGYTLFLTGDEAVLALRSASQESKFESRTEVAQHSLLNAAALPRSFRGGQLQRATDYGPRTTDAFFAPLIQNPKSQIQNLLARPEPRVASPEPRAAAVLRLRLVGANPHTRVTGLDPLPGKSNYFLGNDPKKWRTNVSNYAKVEYENVYPGVDLVYYGNQGKLEYDFVVAPGADPHLVALNIEGAERMHIDPQGDLVLSSDGGHVRLHKPAVYQPTTDSGPRTTGNLQSSIGNRQFLNGRYILTAKNQVAFEIGAYDRSLPLIIDPVLSYATYLGGSGYDEAISIAVDASGNAYVGGETSSPNFPTTEGAFQETSSPTSCAFVTKIAPDGSSLVYSTYLCGSDGVQGVSMAVDAAGNAYVVGGTSSTNFPTTPGAFQTANSGGLDAFVTKLNSTGSSLVYSTYLGGSGDDYAYSYSNGIAVDSAGSAYVVGTTNSDNFPTTPGAFDRTCGSDGVCNRGSGQYPQPEPDNFVTKLNADGSALAYSTYLGGSGYEEQYNAIAIDSSGNAYVTGGTFSADFPITPGAFRTEGGGAFVTKLNAAGSALVYSTYLTGRGAIGEGIAVDTSGNAYVTGYLGTTDFPITPGAFQTVDPGGATFVTKLNATGSALVYSTFLGGSGSGSDEGWGVAVDASGNAYVSGTTSSSDFPTASPVQATCGVGGYDDAFVAKLNGAGSALIFSTCLGGDSSEEGFGNALDPSGNLYVVGHTNSINFPTTLGAFQTSIYGGYDEYGEINPDAFVAKISFPAGPTVLVTPSSMTFGDQLVGTTSMPQAITLTNTGNAALAISSIALSGDFNQSNSCGSGLLAGSSCNIYVSFAPTAAGNRTGALTITDSAPGSPHIVPVAGTGVSTVGGTPAVSVSTLSLYLGNPVVGATVGPRTVTLTNTGDGALTINGCAITGANSADFSFTGCAAGTYSSGAALPIAVSFTPSATGLRTASFSVNDNAPGSPHIVALAGFGMAGFHQCDPLPNVPVNFDVAISTCKYGCALTSSGSALTTFNTTVTPLSLDDYLTPDGYRPNGSGNLYWPAIPLFPVLGGSLQLIDGRDIQPQEVSGYLSDHILAQQQRVILKLCVVSGTQCTPDTHFIVATGSTGSNDWQVLDPGWKNANPQGNLSTLSGHIAGFTTSTGSWKFQVSGVRAFVPSADVRAFSTQAQSPVELLVTDPQGRRLGNAGTGDDIFEIPLGSYLRDFPLASDDGSGPSLGDPTGLKTAYVPSPEDGSYAVVATGTGSGSYTLDVQAVASDGTVQTASVSGVTAPGSTATYEVTYSSAPGSPPSVTRQPTGPIASLSTTAVSFGSQLVGTTSTAEAVTVTNTGDPELTIASMSVSGDFTLGNGTCGAQVAPDGSCTVNITFKPMATGNRTGTLTISDNAPGTPHTVALSGTGTDFSLGAASGGSTSATVNAGQTATYNLQIAPTGFSGSVALSCTWTGSQPRGTNCTVSPTSVNLDGTNPAPFTATVTTMARSLAGPRPDSWPPARIGHRAVPLVVWLLGLMVLLTLAAPRRRRVYASLAVSMLIVLLWAACGGGGGAPAPPPQTGTPAGTYTLTITGTASGVSKTASLTLKVN